MVLKLSLYSRIYSFIPNNNHNSVTSIVDLTTFKQYYNYPHILEYTALYPKIIVTVRPLNIQLYTLNFVYNSAYTQNNSLTNTRTDLRGQ